MNRKQKLWTYFLLTARFLLAWIFIRYGWGKLTGGQFGVSEEELLKPLKDTSLFRLSWYLFDHQPFKAFVGIGQLICGILLLFRRTALLGAFIFIPIALTILIIDISFMNAFMARAFTYRFVYYFILLALILYSYKDQLLKMIPLVFQKSKTPEKFPIWAYLILPVLAFIL